MSNSNELRTFAISFMVGGLSGALVKSLTSPLDRVKVILQTQDVAAQFGEGKRKRYTGVIDCFRRIPKEQGFTSLWRGNIVNTVRYFPSQALNFSFNTWYKERINAAFGAGPLAHFASGALAGVTTVTLLYPLEFCQTRISADVGNDAKDRAKRTDFVEREFRGVSDCISKVTKTEGFHVLYRGYFVAVTGVALYRSFYFGMHGYWKEINKGAELSLMVQLIAAQVITITSGMISYPLDTIGRILMMDVGKPKNEKKLDTVRGVVNLVYRERGVAGFYKVNKVDNVIV
ncbi:ADP,ATP carrier protein 2-like [Photinus pyralis]|uniref:ADP,ATP carrier protein 2-like n=1 Tax=Photinus pyralis TaxID=7054 RepID=UPI0012675518|nr:ADP,ATP carrier protein 2-like [Photinus pyralis]